MEKNFAGQRFTVNLRVKVKVDVYSRTQIYEAIERLYLMLDNDEREGQTISAHLMESEIEDWGVSNVTNLIWED
jgi:hypothetical protein